MSVSRSSDESEYVSVCQRLRGKPPRRQIAYDDDQDDEVDDDDYYVHMNSTCYIAETVLAHRRNRTQYNGASTKSIIQTICKNVVI